LDALAADVSYRHCDGGTKKYTIVTASIDGFRAFDDDDSASLNKIDMIQNDMKLAGYLTFVGKSSMEVCIDLFSVDIQGNETIVGTTQFIMVAR
jgi:acyl-coenzyme A thioesterase 9